MNDIISINRQFLIMAREAAKSTQGEVITGLPRNILNKLAQFSQEEIEKISTSKLNIISMRLNEAEMDRLVTFDDTEHRTSFAVSVIYQREH